MSDIFDPRENTPLGELVRKLAAEQGITVEQLLARLEDYRSELPPGAVRAAEVEAAKRRLGLP